MTKKTFFIAIALVSVLAALVFSVGVKASAAKETDVISTVPEETKEIVVDESNVQEIMDIISGEANVGNIIPRLGYYNVTWMEAEALEGYTPEEILGGFLRYEGGELFEKLLVGQIVMDRVNMEGRSLAEVLCDVRCFGIRADFWELLWSEGISDENFELAKFILEMAETNKDMTKYDGYAYGFIAGETDSMLADFIKDKSQILETNHYLFYAN